MRKYYSIVDMDSYDNARDPEGFMFAKFSPGIEVNPARSLGKEMLDAGRVIFTKGSRVDFNRSFAQLSFFFFLNLSLFLNRTPRQAQE